MGLQPTPKLTGPQKRWLIVPFVLLLLLTIGTVSYYLLQTTRLLDKRELIQATRLAEAALSAELNELGNLAYDFGYRDASINNLIDQLNPQWADENIGAFLFDSYDVSASLVFTADDRLRISFIDGKQADRSSFLDDFKTSLQPLLNQARSPSFLGPKAARGLVNNGQKIYLAAAQAIISEKDPSPLSQKRGVLVLLNLLDPSLLKQISRSYLLPELKLVGQSPQPPQAGLRLNSPLGKQLGFLQWSPDLQGQKIFRDLAPVIPIPLLLTLILTLFFVRRMQLFFRERISLHQQIEHEKIRLEASEGTLRAIIEAIPSPLFFKNSEGYYLGCNKAFCNYLGLPTDKIVGHTVYDVAPGELAQVYHQADLDLMQHSSAQTYEAQVRYADGSRRDILFNKATIDNANGKVVGLVGIMTDICDVKMAQRESRRLRKLLRNVIDSMPSLLITVDEDQRVTEWNRWAAVASRVPAHQALGRPLFEVFPELAEHHIDITAALTSGKIKIWRRVPWNLRNREIFIDLTVYPLDKSKNKGAVLRAENTTDRVRMEEMMVLSEKMLSIGSLAAGMAHAINNPLAIILQHTQILQNRLNPALDKNISVAETCGIRLDHLSEYLQQRGIDEMLAAIRRAGDRAKIIVEEMVNFSQRHEDEYALCNLSALVDETLYLAETDYDLKKKYAFREIRVSKEIAPDLPQLICDRHEIQQVLLNLLRNSAKAMHEAQTEKPLIRILLQSDAQNIRIELIDNGPGINPGIMSRIFDPFFTSSGVGEGTGLGLSVAYFIIHDKHGGSMRAVNQAEGGCRVLIDLPLESQHSLSTQEPA